MGEKNLVDAGLKVTNQSLKVCDLFTSGCWNGAQLHELVGEKVGAEIEF